jgi:hypothetical protein
VRVKRARSVALATCAQLPDLDDDERLVIDALADLTVVAAPRVWDDPTVLWDEYELVVIRSTWDYATRRGDFLSWVASLPSVLNAPDVLTWNTDKVYLRELAAAGIRTVSTAWIEPGASPDTISLPDGELVVKPAVSAGAWNTARYGAADGDRARRHVDRLLSAGRTVMVQPYVGSVDGAGETGLIYIDGVLSHSVRKGPLLIRSAAASDQLFAREEISKRDASNDERQLAENTLDALPWSRRELLYARVDMVRSQDGTPMLIELELTEPSLFFALGDGAAERFAKATANRLASV